MWLAENTVIAGAMAGVVFALIRFVRPRPAVCHVLWLLVVAKLVMPPVLAWETSTVPAEASATIEVSGGNGGSVLPITRQAEPDTGIAVPRIEEVAAVPESEGGDPAEGDEGSEARPVDGDPLPPDPALVPERVSGQGVAGSFPWFNLALLMWGAGAVVLVVGAVRRVRGFRAHLAAARPASDRFENAVAEVSSRLGVTAPPVLVVPGLAAPCVGGMWRTRLYWPARRGPLEAGRVRAVLTHELAHIKRKDLWVARALDLLQIAFWWHPLFWFARARVEEFSEQACDAWALRLEGVAPRAYADAILEFHTGDQPHRAVPATVAMGTRGRATLRRRLLRVMEGGAPRRLPVAVAAASVCLGALTTPHWTVEEPWVTSVGLGQAGPEPGEDLGVDNTAAEELGDPLAPKAPPPPVTPVAEMLERAATGGVADRAHAVYQIGRGGEARAGIARSLFEMLPSGDAGLDLEIHRAIGATGSFADAAALRRDLATRCPDRRDVRSEWSLALARLDLGAAPAQDLLVESLLSGSYVEVIAAADHVAATVDKRPAVRTAVGKAFVQLACEHGRFEDRRPSQSLGLALTRIWCKHPKIDRAWWLLREHFDPVVRAEALTVLSTKASDKVVIELVRALGDPHPGVVEAAREGLVCAGDRAIVAVPALRSIGADGHAEALLKNVSPVARTVAAFAAAPDAAGRMDLVTDLFRGGATSAELLGDLIAWRGGVESDRGLMFDTLAVLRALGKKARPAREQVQRLAAVKDAALVGHARAALEAM